MKTVSFRIKNYRSIIDSGWCDLSPDNITVLIGQNEAGKSSVLDALSAFEYEEIDKKSLRTSGQCPEVTVCYKVEPSEFNSIFEEYDTPDGLICELENLDWKICITRTWAGFKCDSDETLKIENKQLKEVVDAIDKSFIENNELEAEASSEIQSIKRLTEEIFAISIWNESPNITEFSESNGLLPDEIDIKDLKEENSTESNNGAHNFLKLAGLTLEDFEHDENRFIKDRISVANKKITKEFRNFWSQRIGKSIQIELACELEHYSARDTAKAGEPYLVFWVSDGGKRLTPSQRSKGVRWFTSFFLKLKADSIDNKSRVYLLDEPGGSLHEKAQNDMLKLLESISLSIPIVYTTHSPSLIDLNNLHRITAVERYNDEDDNSPTKIIHSHELITASKETIAPVLRLMGANFSNQNLIRIKNNIILEELSAFYYFKAFVLLLEKDLDLAFIPSTGVDTVPQLVNLFIGWGLEFIVVLDDDKHARKVYNSIKRNVYLDDAEKANKHLMKIKGCNGIEDIFKENDFYDVVLEGKHKKEEKSNSEYMKSSKLSKIYTAVNLEMNVKNGKVKLKDFSKETVSEIKGLIDSISEKLI